MSFDFPPRAEGIGAFGGDRGEKVGDWVEGVKNVIFDITKLTSAVVNNDCKLR